MCAVFLGVIEGVGIGFQRMMADNTKLEVRLFRVCRNISL
jgi:import inner membrane translocase subunit TIM17